jgi:hypothetical protein
MIPDFLTAPRTTGLIIACGLIFSIANALGIPEKIWPPDVPEFDHDEEGFKYANNYGNNATNCNLVAKGHEFLKYQGDYRLSMGCVFDNSSMDIKDEHLFVGALFDITDSNIPMTAPLLWSGTPKLGSIKFYILMVPRSISIAQFNTIREARNVGVRVVWVGGQS